MLKALMHDCGEAYLPDIARDVKESTYFLTPWGIERFDDVENRCVDVIFEALEIPGGAPPIVKRIIKESDNRAMVSERDSQIRLPDDLPLTLTEPLEGVEFEPMSPADSEQIFLDDYRHLKNLVDQGQ